MDPGKVGLTIVCLQLFIVTTSETGVTMKSILAKERGRKAGNRGHVRRANANITDICMLGDFRGDEYIRSAKRLMWMLIALSAATIYMYVIRLSEYEDRQHYALIEAALNIPNYANRIKHMSVLDFIMIFSAPAINMADAATGMPQKLTIDNAYVTDGVDSLIYGPQIIVAPNLPAISIKCQIAYFYLGREYIPSLDGALMRASGQNIRGVYYVRYSKFCKYANVGVTEAVYIDTDDGNYIGLPGDAVKNILGEIGIPFLAYL